MLFSVIVPMYNVEVYAKECIESILNQSYKDFELILVDDGSEDSTPNIIDEYAQKDNRIIAIHKENGGLVSARKAGLLKSSGEYIVPVDGDDWIDLSYLEKFANIIFEHIDIDIVCCDCCNVYENGKRTKIIGYEKYGLLKREDIEKTIYPKVFEFQPNLCEKVFKKNIYKKKQLDIDERISMGEDMAVLFPLLFEINSIYVIDEALYYYRRNSKSMTCNKTKEFSSIGLLSRVEHFHNNLPLDKYNLKNQLSIRVVHDTFNVVLSYFRANKYKEAVKKSKKLLREDSLDKHIKKKLFIANKKEWIAKKALKYRLFWLVKIYSYIYD